MELNCIHHFSSTQKKVKEKRGAIFALYLAFYGFGRYFIEGLRTDSLMVTEMIRASQSASLILIFADILYFVFVSIKKPRFPNYDGRYMLGYEEKKSQA